MELKDDICNVIGFSLLNKGYLNLKVDDSSNWKRSLK